MLQRIDNETAIALNELGINEPCSMMYYKGELTGAKIGMGNKPNDYEGFYAAYYQEEVCKMFRDKYNIHVCFDLSVVLRKGKYHWFVRVDNMLTNEYLYHSEDNNIYFNTYEKSQLAGIKEAIKILKDG